MGFKIQSYIPRTHEMKNRIKGACSSFFQKIYQLPEYYMMFAWKIFFSQIWGRQLSPSPHLLRLWCLDIVWSLCQNEPCKKQPIEMPPGTQIHMRQMNHVLDGGTYKRHLANTIKWSILSGYASFDCNSVAFSVVIIRGKRCGIQEFRQVAHLRSLGHWAPGHI